MTKAEEVDEYVFKNWKFAVDEEAAALSTKEESVDNFDAVYELIKVAANKRGRKIEVSKNMMTSATMANLSREGFYFDRQTRPAPTCDNWNHVETYYEIYW